jgi:arylsulfatase A-like enzyme
VLVFTADNGGWHEDQGNGEPAGGNNFPLRGQKLDHWEGGIRLPTFVLSPLINQSQVGLVDSVNLFHHSDWYPTFLGLAGVAVEEGLDGIDQWQTIAFGAPSPRREILSIHMVDLKYNSKYIRDIDGFKLLVNSNWTSGNFPPPENTTTASALPAASTASTSAVSLWPNLCDAFLRRFRRLPSKSLLPELYFLVNILTDPYEQVNLANDYPDVVAELRARLEVKLQEAATPCMLDDPLCPNWNNGSLYSWN